MNKHTENRNKIGFTKEQIEKFMLKYECCSTSYEVYDFCQSIGWKDNNDKVINTIFDAIDMYESYKIARNERNFSKGKNKQKIKLGLYLPIGNLPDNGMSYIAYSDGQYAISTFIRGGKKNKDLIEMFYKCTKHIKHLRFHWVKGHNGDKYNEMADDLAFSAYREICEEYKIPIGKRMNKTH